MGGHLVTQPARGGAGDVLASSSALTGVVVPSSLVPVARRGAHPRRRRCGGVGVDDLPRRRRAAGEGDRPARWRPPGSLAARSARQPAWRATTLEVEGLGTARAFARVEFDAEGDHRMAMAAAVAAAVGCGRRRRGFRGRRDQLPGLPRGPSIAAMTGSIVVAIDGPAGSGKSTVARALADRLGLEVLDTGAMYRAVTVLALRAGLDLADADKVTLVAREADLEVGDRVRSHGADLTDELRTDEVNRAVSVVSAHPGVRSALVGPAARVGGGARGRGRRGARHRHGRVPRRAAEGVPDRQRRRAGAPPDRGARGLGRSGATSSTSAARRRRCGPPTTPTSSTRPTGPSTTSSSRSCRCCERPAVPRRAP